LTAKQQAAKEAAKAERVANRPTPIATTPAPAPTRTTNAGE
jgi:hypothetical protein